MDELTYFLTENDMHYLENVLIREAKREQFERFVNLDLDHFYGTIRFESIYDPQRFRVVSFLRKMIPPTTIAIGNGQ